MFKKVLSPVDFSQESATCIQYTYQLAQKLNATLVLLHVVQNDYTIYNVSAKASREEVKTAVQEKFNLWLTQHQFTNNVFSILKFGEITEAIAEEAEKNEVNLIVMFTRGVDEAEWLGTNTAKVAKIAPCPVLSIKDIGQTVQFRKILFPIDPKFTVKSLENEAKFFAKAMEAEVQFVSVGEENENGKLVMKKYVEAYQTAGVKANYVFIDREESIAETLMDYAREQEFELIVMATHARMGLKALILGSVTEACINHANAPILTLKA